MCIGVDTKAPKFNEACLSLCAEDHWLHALGGHTLPRLQHRRGRVFRVWELAV